MLALARVEELALARCPPPFQSHQDGGRVHHRAHVVHVGEAPARGLAVGQARGGGQSAVRLRRRPDRAVARVRTRLPEPRGRQVDDVGTEGARPLVVEPPARHHSRREALRDHVAVWHQLARDTPPLVRRHVDRDALLPHVDLCEEAAPVHPRPSVRVRPRETQEVERRRVRPLDPQDLRAQRREDARRPRPREVPREIEHADAVERMGQGAVLGHGAYPPFSRSSARRIRKGAERAVSSHDSSGRFPVRCRYRLKPLMTPNL